MCSPLALRGAKGEGFAPEGALVIEVKADAAIFGRVSCDSNGLRQHFRPSRGPVEGAAPVAGFHIRPAGGRNSSEPPRHWILGVRSLRDHTISGRGFNPFTPLRRHFRATRSNSQPVRSLSCPRKRVSGEDGAEGWTASCSRRARRGAISGRESSLFNRLRHHLRATVTLNPFDPCHARESGHPERTAPKAGRRRRRLRTPACAGATGVGGASRRGDSRGKDAVGEHSPASRFPRPGWPRGDPRRLTASEFHQ